MKAHIIENNKVVNTIEVESLDFLPNLIDGSIGGIGWDYINGELIAPIKPEPPKVIPQSITIRQAREIVIKMGLFQTVEDTLNGIEDDTQRLIARNYWEYSEVFERNHQILLALTAALGLTDEQLDEMFIAASKL